MAFRQKHIATKFWIHSIVSTLMIILLMAFAILASSNKKRTTDIIKIRESIAADIDRIQNNFEKARLLQKSDAEFVPVTCENLIVEQKQLIKNISDSIEKIAAVSYLKRPLKKSGLTDSLLILLDDYSSSFEKTLLSLKEIGNVNQGLVSSIVAPSNQLSETISGFSLFHQKSVELEKKTINFLATLNLLDTRELNQFCQDLNNQLQSEGYDPILYDASLSTLIKNLTEIELIETRLMNPLSERGQIVDLNLYYTQITRDFQKFSTLINKAINQRTIIWNIWLVLLTIILIGINLLLLYLFSRKSTLSLKSLKNSTFELSIGSLEVELSNKSNWEFIDLNHHLDMLKSQLITKKKYVEKILNKNFDEELEILSEKDELGNKLIALKDQLLKAQEEQTIHEKQTERRRYINEGLAKFSDIMRQNSNNTVALGDNLIKALVKYLDAQQGSIFLTDEGDENKLNLIAAFAFDRKKYLQKTIVKGEGLVGTCAIEKSTINLTEVPEEYVIIKSGLGDAPPRNIVIVPVMHEFDLVGVVELAALKILSDYEIELVEQISSSLASTILTVRSNTKTAQLLEKSQQQAAEMSEQEEEMRQNMEELKATQEESSRREEEMLGIIEAIGTSFFVIEYNLDGSISHVNERLAKFLEMPIDSIIKRKHREIFSINSVVNAELFNKIISDRKAVNITETLNWGSREYVYKHSLSPVLSKYGEILKIMNLLDIDVKKGNKKKD